jgi:Holliday junction resolvase-like predicted endonuclease
MSCNSSQSTVENPKGSGDNSVNVLDSEGQKSKETSTNPSVHQQEGEIDLLTSDTLESVNEEKRQRTLSQKAIHNAIQNKSTELSKAAKSLFMSSDTTVLTALEKNISNKGDRNCPCTITTSLHKVPSNTQRH